MAPIAKRRKVEQVEEITFDSTARQEYLTGFHKRKLQRIENARETAAKQVKEERVRERRQIREQRKEDLTRHVAEVNAELRKQNPDLSENESVSEVNGDEVEWDGIDEKKAEDLQDEEFVDEDKYTTVTVEAMADPRDEADQDAESKAAAVKALQTNGDAKKSRSKWKKDNKAKSKKRKFRYESKAERSATRQKQKSKNHAAAVRRKGK